MAHQLQRSTFEDAVDQTLVDAFVPRTGSVILYGTLGEQRIAALQGTYPTDNSLGRLLLIGTAEGPVQTLNSGKRHAREIRYAERDKAIAIEMKSGAGGGKRQTASVRTNWGVFRRVENQPYVPETIAGRVLVAAARGVFEQFTPANWRRALVIGHTASGAQVAWLQGTLPGKVTKEDVLLFSPPGADPYDSPQVLVNPLPHQVNTALTHHVLAAHHNIRWSVPWGVGISAAQTNIGDHELVHTAAYHSGLQVYLDGREVTPYDQSYYTDSPLDRELASTIPHPQRVGETIPKPPRATEAT